MDPEAAPLGICEVEYFEDNSLTLTLTLTLPYPYP